MPTRQQLIAWLHDHFDGMGWPAPTLVENTIDIIIAPLYDNLVGVFNKPTAWWNVWRQRINTELTSYGVSTFTGLSATTQAEVVLGWWESYCAEDETAPYAQDNQGGG